ncbi:hypothetical protein V1525DRAFT_398249 [Lipomyces kononenkoae]|uniref:Uncharacterized protein n=1 Tax=Lipomyces kononenkoae TaxID=34357 RepID=A0ACC3T7F8_LIPKO
MPARRSERNVARKSYRFSPDPEDSDQAEAPSGDDLVDPDDIVFEDDDDLEDIEFHQEELVSSPERAENSSAKKVAPEELTPIHTRPRSTRKAKPRDFGLSENEMTEIEEVFLMGCDKDGNFPVENMEDAIIALGCDTSSSELQDIVETADPEARGDIERDTFMEIMAYKYQERKREVATGVNSVNSLVEHAFQLFIDNRPDRQYISIQDLRNAAILANDEVTDEDLQEMLRVASGNAYGTVSFENFATVIKRSGAIV